MATICSRSCRPAPAKSDLLPAAGGRPARPDARHFAAHFADEGPGRRSSSTRDFRRRAPLVTGGRRAARGFDAVRGGGLRLLYVAPERFASPRFTEMVSGVPLARFVVDEAHCVSSWGHDFRPDYRRLSAAAHACRRSDGAAGRPPMLAFTATATPEVRDDIVSLLGLQQPKLFVSGFDRPNIELRVLPVSGDIDKHQRLPALVGKSRALVYGATRRRAEEAAATLDDRGARRGAIPRRALRARALARPGRVRGGRGCRWSARPTRSGWGSIGRISTP